MENSDIARQLTTFRKTIDNIDAALIHLLAERFRCTDEVGLTPAPLIEAIRRAEPHEMANDRANSQLYRFTLRLQLGLPET
ncbi:MULTISPECIES: chorismate mutase [Pseudomonas]|uniref:chorismate mutase n=1 Tax=Pseudomonas TaxID=286 RepID=UPI000A1EF653|nr:MULTISPECIES: chorismate mutase [Pseudomonas]UIN53552.1 chorismate mutase [Pseudomonas kribbensis]